MRVPASPQGHSRWRARRAPAAWQGFLSVVHTKPCMFGQPARRQTRSGTASMELYALSLRKRSTVSAARRSVRRLKCIGITIAGSRQADDLRRLPGAEAADAAHRHRATLTWPSGRSATGAERDRGSPDARRSASRNRRHTPRSGVDRAFSGCRSQPMTTTPPFVFAGPSSHMDFAQGYQRVLPGARG